MGSMELGSQAFDFKSDFLIISHSFNEFNEALQAADEDATERHSCFLYDAESSSNQPDCF
jgi:hypothetical protein